MLSKNLLAIRFNTKKQKLIALLVVLVVELIFIGYVWVQSKPPPAFALLVKRGNSYLVAWKSDSGYEKRNHDNLSDAIKFLNYELKLSRGKNPSVGGVLEHMWVQDRFGSYMLMWKTESLSYLNQISFNSRDDATFFANAFRAGSYAVTPFGHSVIFMPAEVN